MKLVYTLLLLALLSSSQAWSQQFITRWNMSIGGTAPTQLLIGVQNVGTVNYTWETIPVGLSGSGTLIGGSSIIYGLPAGSMIRLFIDTTNFRGINLFSSADRDRLIDIEQWGGAHWSYMGSAFRGCENLNITASDVPDLSGVTDMSELFWECTSLNGPANINNWNTSNVVNMRAMFTAASNFNQPIGNWNVSNVTNMAMMFSNATNFNQPIGNWNTSNVISMALMFSNATNFNQPIGNWNVSNVVSMGFMFSDASNFNQPLNNWDVSNVFGFTSMFINATNFNQPLNNWNVSNADLANMFNNATNFNQSLGAWQLGQGVNLYQMLHFSGLDCSNYSATLLGWSNNANLPTNKNLGAFGLKYYSYAQASRNYLINNKGWIIVGDSLANQNCCLSPSYTNVFDIACNSYLFNNQNLTSSGVYYDTLLNASGCDSIIVLNLTVNQANASITQAGANLSANTSGATYQWISCNPYQIISGAINQNYTATVNGDYAVIVTENGCSDTSTCVTVMGIGLNENNNDKRISIYPNPTKDKLYVNIGSVNVEPQTYIEIYNTLGQLLFTKDINPHTQTELDISHLAKGMYYLRVGHIVAKLIVE